jgi:hypothetical protein
LRQFFPVNLRPDAGFLFRKPEQTSPADGIGKVNNECKEKTMANDEAMTDVFFKPWVGENYKAKGFNGKTYRYGII